MVAVRRVGSFVALGGTVSGRPWRALVAPPLAFAGALFAFVNCGPDEGTGTFPTRDAGLKDVTVDAADAADARVTRVDAGPPVTSNGCTLHDGWQILHPFSPVCLKSQGPGAQV